MNVKQEEKMHEDRTKAKSDPSKELEEKGEADVGEKKR